MKHIIILTLLVTGCATHHYRWDKMAEVKTNFAEAHSDCIMKSRVAVGWPQGEYDWGYNKRINRFISECMEGQGYLFKQID